MNSSDPKLGFIVNVCNITMIIDSDFNMVIHWCWWSKNRVLVTERVYWSCLSSFFFINYPRFTAEQQKQTSGFSLEFLHPLTNVNDADLSDVYQVKHVSVAWMAKNSDYFLSKEWWINWSMNSLWFHLQRVVGYMKIKGTVYPKTNSHLHTLKLLQTCVKLFLLLNTKENTFEDSR